MVYRGGFYWDPGGRNRYEYEYYCSQIIDHIGLLLILWKHKVEEPVTQPL